MDNDVKNINDHITGCRHGLGIIASRPCNDLGSYAVQDDLKKVFLSQNVQNILYHLSCFFAAYEVPNQVKQLGLNGRIVLHRMDRRIPFIYQGLLTSFDSVLPMPFWTGFLDLFEIAGLEPIGPS